MSLCQCEYCQKVFNNVGGQKICPACAKEIDEVFARVRKYMYSTSEQVTVTKLVEELGVSEKAVNFLIKEHRLTFGPRVKGGGRCRVCGAPTDGQALCKKCQAAFSESMKEFKAEDARRKQDSTAGKFANPMVRRHDQDD
jgi:predicted amidophosphoribosyltransferase